MVSSVERPFTRSWRSWRHDHRPNRPSEATDQRVAVEAAEAALSDWLQWRRNHCEAHKVPRKWEGQGRSPQYLKLNQVTILNHLTCFPFKNQTHWLNSYYTLFPSLETCLHGSIFFGFNLQRSLHLQSSFPARTPWPHRWRRIALWCRSCQPHQSACRRWKQCLVQLTRPVCIVVALLLKPKLWPTPTYRFIVQVCSAPPFQYQDYGAKEIGQIGEGVFETEMTHVIHPKLSQLSPDSIQFFQVPFLPREHGNQGAVPQGSLLHIHLLVHVHSCRNLLGHPSPCPKSG